MYVCVWGGGEGGLTLGCTELHLHCVPTDQVLHQYCVSKLAAILTKVHQVGVRCGSNGVVIICCVITC